MSKVPNCCKKGAFSLEEPFVNKMSSSSPANSTNFSCSPDVLFAEFWIPSTQKKITIWARSPKVTPILNWITSANFHFLIWNTGFSQKASKIEWEMASAQSGLYSCSCSDTHVWTDKASRAKLSPFFPSVGSILTELGPCRPGSHCCWFLAPAGLWPSSLYGSALEVLFPVRRSPVDTSH